MHNLLNNIYGFKELIGLMYIKRNLLCQKLLIKLLLDNLLKLNLHKKELINI